MIQNVKYFHFIQDKIFGYLESLYKWRKCIKEDDLAISHKFTCYVSWLLNVILYRRKLIKSSNMAFEFGDTRLTLLINMGMSFLGFLLCLSVIPKFKDMFIKANLYGIDLCKPSKEKVYVTFLSVFILKSVGAYRVPVL